MEEHNYLLRKKQIAVASAQTAAIIEKMLYTTGMFLAIWAMLTDMRKTDSVMNLKSFLVSFCVIKNRPDDRDTSAGIDNKDALK